MLVAVPLTIRLPAGLSQNQACALGWCAAGPQAMGGAKDAAHHGVPENIPSFATNTKQSWESMM